MRSSRSRIQVGCSSSTMPYHASTSVGSIIRSKRLRAIARSSFMPSRSMASSSSAMAISNRPWTDWSHAFRTMNISRYAGIGDQPPSPTNDARRYHLSEASASADTSASGTTYPMVKTTEGGIMTFSSYRNAICAAKLAAPVQAERPSTTAAKTRKPIPPDWNRPSRRSAIR